MFSAALIAVLPQGQLSAPAEPAATGSVARRPDDSGFADELAAALAGSALLTANASPPLPAAPAPSAPAATVNATPASNPGDTPTNTQAVKTADGSGTNPTTQPEAVQSPNSSAKPTNPDSSATSASSAGSTGLSQPTAAAATQAALAHPGAAAAPNATLPAAPATPAPQAADVPKAAAATVPTNIPNAGQPTTPTAGTAKGAATVPTATLRAAPDATAGTATTSASGSATPAPAAGVAASAVPAAATEQQGGATGRPPSVQETFARAEAAGLNGPTTAASVAPLTLTPVVATAPTRADTATARPAPAPAASGPMAAYAAQPASASALATGAAAPARPVADQLGDAILAQLDSSPGEGRIDIHLRLDPPELGQVHVQLTLSNQTLSARLMAHDDATRQLIQNQMDSLRQRLQDTGLGLGQLDVSGGGGRGGQRQQTLFPSPDLGGGTVLTAVAPQSAPAALVAAGRVDVVA